MKDFVTIVLRLSNKDVTMGEGSKIVLNLRDVIYGRPLIKSC